MIDILDLVVKRLDLWFGGEIPIIAEQDFQNFPTPSILVSITDTELKRETQERFWYDLFMTATYTPADGYIDEYEFQTVSQKLLFALEAVPLDEGYMHARNISTSHDGGEIICIVHYAVYLKQKMKEIPRMEKLHQKFISKKEVADGE